MPKYKRPYKRARTSQANKLSPGWGQLAPILSAVKQLAGGDSAPTPWGSSGKADQGQAVESKDNPTGVTYIRKEKSKKMRRMNRKKLIKRRKFNNRVMRAVNANQLGTKLFQFTDSFVNSSVVPVDAQGMASFCLFGNQLTTFGTGRGYRDLRRMLTVDGNATSGTRFQITGLYSQFTLFNNNQPQFFVDIYQISNKKNESDAAVVGDILSNELATGGTQAGTGAVTINTFGLTPFQSPLFLQRFKIITKTTVALGSNETYKFDVRRHAPFTYDADKLNDYTYIWPTFSYLFVYYGRPQNDAGTIRLAASLPVNSLIISNTRTYYYKRTVTGVNQPTDVAQGIVAS